MGGTRERTLKGPPPFPLGATLGLGLAVALAPTPLLPVLTPPEDAPKEVLAVAPWLALWICAARPPLEWPGTASGPVPAI